MGGLALLARQAGYRVTGCDANVYPPMSTQLAAQGVVLIEGYGEDQLAIKPDLWVIGNVITRGNPLMEAILDRAGPFVSGPEWLAQAILRGKWVLAVSGTHGKTTASAILAWILEETGYDPGYLIGGMPQNFGTSARLTQAPVFVIEADEYDTAFFDKRSKFVHYRAKTAILNNIEFDHADIFADLAAIETHFHHFVRILPQSGLIVANGRDPVVERVLRRGCWTPTEKFGVEDGWHAENLSDDAFEVRLGKTSYGRAQLDLAGEHNRMNALAAIAAARHVGTDPSRAVEALSRFRGVKRRMELRGRAAGVTVYDDFAHHPTAIAASIEGLRRVVNGERIIAILEPRSNTMKLGVMKDALPASLAGADRVFCYAKDLGWDARAALAPLGARAVCAQDLEALVSEVLAEARAGDHVLVMSNGAFGGIHDKLLAALERRGGAEG